MNEKYIKRLGYASMGGFATMSVIHFGWLFGILFILVFWGVMSMGITLVHREED